MSGDLIWNLALVVLFVLIGGVFAATEMALVTLRESQLSAIAARGRRGERVAALARNPNTFLSAVQIGVTVAGWLRSDSAIRARGRPVSSCQAATAPEDGPWIYYVTVNLATGETKFAETLSEHNVNVAELNEYCRTQSDRC